MAQFQLSCGWAATPTNMATPITHCKRLVLQLSLALAKEHDSGKLQPLVLVELTVAVDVKSLHNAYDLAIRDSLRGIASQKRAIEGDALVTNMNRAVPTCQDQNCCQEDHEAGAKAHCDDAELTMPTDSRPLFTSPVSILPLSSSSSSSNAANCNIKGVGTDAGSDSWLWDEKSTATRIGCTLTGKELLSLQDDGMHDTYRKSR